MEVDFPNLSIEVYLFSNGFVRVAVKTYEPKIVTEGFYAAYVGGGGAKSLFIILEQTFMPFLRRIFSCLVILPLIRAWMGH